MSDNMSAALVILFFAVIAGITMILVGFQARNAHRRMVQKQSAATTGTIVDRVEKHAHNPRAASISSRRRTSASSRENCGALAKSGVPPRRCEAASLLACSPPVRQGGMKPPRRLHVSDTGLRQSCGPVVTSIQGEANNDP